MKLQDIQNLLNTNAKKKSYFVRWYCTTDKKDEKSYKSIETYTQVKFETAMNEWILEEDVQSAIKEYMKAQRNIKMMEIYNSMYDKALKGDVKASEWVEKFFKSDFFENKTDIIDDFLDGIDIPSLEGDK